MRKFTRTALATALMLGVSAPALAQFSGTYFFGDSLTDGGSFKPALPPGTGLFTTNPGPVWSQVFAGSYGFAANPANQGGTNYAEGGARVASLPGVPNQPPTGTATPIATQVSRYVTAGIRQDAIHSVWGGANDIFYQLGLLSAGQITAAQLSANVSTAAVDLVKQVGALHAAGAKYIVVLNLPDIGKTPFGTASGQATQISAISGLYNSTLSAGLDTLGFTTLRLNISGLFNEILAAPAAYGLVNTTTPACGTTPSLLCTSANLVAPGAAATFLFADGVHPTTAGHALVAQYVESVLRAPQQVAVLAEAPLAVEEANWRTIDGRMMSGTNSVRPAGKFEAWAAYDYSNPDIDSGFATGDATINTLAVGGDIRLSENLLAGASASFAENKGDLGSGGYKLKQTSATVYVGYGHGPWYVGATVGGGDIDYSDVTRTVQLGTQTRTESGETRGFSMVGRVLGGYWFNAGDWVHGPFAKYTYQEIEVRGYQERGSNSTTMSFDEQKRKSSVATVGWQASGRLGSVRPFGRVTWEYEMDNDERSVGAATLGMNDKFSIPAYKPDKDYVQFNLGAATDIGRVTVYLNGSATTGKSDGDSYAITAGVRLPM